MADFREWLLFIEDSHQSRGKQGLYPPQYSQADNYTSQDVITWGADAFTYMPQEKKVFKMNWGKGILSNPNPGEVNKEGWPEGRPDYTGAFKMIYGDGILSKTRWEK